MCRMTRSSSVGSAPISLLGGRTDPSTGTGSEGLLLLEPANLTQIDDLRQSHDPSEPHGPRSLPSYHVDWALLNTTDSSMLSFGSQSVNSTQSDAEVVIIGANETQRGWMDLRVNLTSNGTTLVSRRFASASTMMGCIAASPSTPGWDVRFLEQDPPRRRTERNSMTTLRVTIPADQPPGFHGFDLNVATTSGNTTRTSLLVIEVSQSTGSRSHGQGRTLPEAPSQEDRPREPCRSSIQGARRRPTSWICRPPTERGARRPCAPRSLSRFPRAPRPRSSCRCERVHRPTSGEVCTFSATVRTTQDANVIQTLPVTIDVGQRVAFSIEPLTLSP